MGAPSPEGARDRAAEIPHRDTACRRDCGVQRPERRWRQRFIDALGNVLPKNGERTLKNDYKLDLRLVKSFTLGRVHLLGIVDGFNILNTENWGSYGTTYGTSTYLVAGSSTNLFYQPRQIQFGVRATY